MTGILWHRSLSEPAVYYRREQDFRRRCPCVTYHWEELDGPGLEIWGWVPYGEYVGMREAAGRGARE